MKEKIEKIREKLQNETVKNKEALEQFRIQYLGSKGLMKELFGELKSVANEHKKEAGQLLNHLRMDLEALYEKYTEELNQDTNAAHKMDLSRPAEDVQIGSRHPLSLVN